MQEGDFLSAIELARSYYVGDAPGNRNGLPDDPQQRRAIIGEKMHDLMVASARYAFSEDRMTDSTHVTPDGRGVDRTSLFEGLVTTCARACIALDDYEFLFEDLFSGIRGCIHIPNIPRTAGVLCDRQQCPICASSDNAASSRYA